MKLTGLDISKSGDSTFTAELACPWCDRVAAIALGPQHRFGNVDLHCEKCARFSSHKIADKWFDQHNQKLQDERQVWKNIPETAYVSCRRGMQGSGFVYTLYLGKDEPREIVSRDVVQHIMEKEFGMTWEQGNAALMSAALTPGLRVYFRHLTKISSALETKTQKHAVIKTGAIVAVNGKEALFLRYSSDGFAVVAFPGMGDTEVPVVELEVLDAGDSPAEVGFPEDEFLLETPMGEGETEETEQIEDLADVEMYVDEIIEHSQMIKDRLEELTVEEAQEDEEEREEGEILEPKKDKEDAEDEGDHEFRARRRADIAQRLQTLQNIIQDPNTDSETLQRAQMQYQQLKKSAPPVIQPLKMPVKPGVPRAAALSKKSWWDKSEKELETQDRPKRKSLTPTEESAADRSDLYPRENEDYPEYARDDEHVKKANRAIQALVHRDFVQMGNLKAAMTAHQDRLSIADIRDILKFYTVTGKLASTEADELARWFVGTKPRLLSARQIRANAVQVYKFPNGFRPEAEKTFKWLQHYNLHPSFQWNEGELLILLPQHEVGSLRQMQESNPARFGNPTAQKGSSLSKKALLDKGMGIFQPALYKGKEVLVMAIDNTGNNATVEDSDKNQFQVPVADLTPTKVGPYTKKPRG